jgi:hypothetical protein
MKTVSRLRMLGVAALAVSGLAGPAQAGYVVTLQQEGANVVASGSGPIDLTGLTFSLTDTLVFGVINAIIAGVETGPTAFVSADAYNGTSGPMSFGSGGQNDASSGSGDFVGIANSTGNLLVPPGYVSDSPLSDTATYDNQTFTGLGVTPGVYEWKWGSGANQNFTLDIVAGAVPEPSTWAMVLLGFAGLGYAGYRRAWQAASACA